MADTPVGFAVDGIELNGNACLGGSPVPIDQAMHLHPNRWVAGNLWADASAVTPLNHTCYLDIDRERVYRS